MKLHEVNPAETATDKKNLVTRNIKDVEVIRLV